MQVTRFFPAPEAAAFGGDFAAGVKALGNAEWALAADCFQAAIEADADSAEAWEGLAEAAWWLADDGKLFEARERSYQLYNGRRDRLGAGRAATWLAADSVEMRGQPAVANGWLQRASRLLEGRHDTLEFGWLLLTDARLMLMLGGDIADARGMASRATSLARRLAIPDLEAAGLSVEGLAMVTSGSVREGVRRLDEAAAAVISGEVSDLSVVAVTLCILMAACERIRDHERARQWCAKARQVSEERTFPALLALCRPYYADVLMWQGDWRQAEEQLEAASREAAEFVPPYVFASTVRLGSLRWRQGRWEEAERLFGQLEHQPLAQLGLAELAASKGDLPAAIDRAERHLRRIQPGDRLERAPALEMLVRCLAAVGERARAEEHVRELRQIADYVATDPLRASAALAEGVLARCAGDLPTAQRWLEDAVDLFERHGAPFEAGRARIALAETLAGRGRVQEAHREAAIAEETLRRIGAVREAQRAREVALTARRDAGKPGQRDSLTPREVEVLNLLALGRSNQEIAGDLVLSVRTVERHISSIYQKLGLAGRTARTAAAAYVHRRGL